MNIECQAVEGPSNRAGWTVEVEGRNAVKVVEIPLVRGYLNEARFFHGNHAKSHSVRQGRGWCGIGAPAHRLRVNMKPFSENF